MYDPYWAPAEKTLSVFAEALAALAALGLLVMFHIRKQSAQQPPADGVYSVGSDRAG
jgi:hypothetical protein